MDDNEQQYRTGRHVVFNLKAHVVLVTKYRRGVITDRVRELLIAQAGYSCELMGARLLEADGEDDHLHLLVEYPPKIAVSKLVGAIKTNTSRRVREQQWPEVTQRLYGDHFWSPSYFVGSTGGAGESAVAQYIQQQRQEPKRPGRPREVR